MNLYQAALSLMVKDHASLDQAALNYGPSWKLRGGVGAFHVIARKWDRIETAMGWSQDPEGWPDPELTPEDFNACIEVCDVDRFFRLVLEDKRPEGIWDDIRDLRRYAFLVIDEWFQRYVKAQEPYARGQIPLSWRLLATDVRHCVARAPSSHWLESPNPENVLGLLQTGAFLFRRPEANFLDISSYWEIECWLRWPSTC